MNIDFPPLIVFTKIAHLGPTNEFTVYFKELYGILMALEILRDRDSGGQRPVFFFVDNQSAIRSSYRPRN